MKFPSPPQFIAGTSCALRSALCAVGLALALGTTSPASAATSTSAEPLVQQSNITYVGAFQLDAGSGTTTLPFGGYGTGFYRDTTGRATLYLQGNGDNGQVAQVAIPATLGKAASWSSDSSLPKGTYLQNFADATNSSLSTAGDTYNGMPIFGMLPYNGRLIVAVAQSYGSSQIATHGASSLNLGSGHTFKGFYPLLAAAQLRAVGGYMGLIPPEWQSAFGGPALTGNCCLSIIGATSAGPAATVFNPDDVGVKSPLTGTTVLNYPLETPLCGAQNCEATQNASFNLTSRVRGVAFPVGSRSVLFFGTHGTGPYCYGTEIECNDQYADGKGPHAPPYVDQIWAYDANDLIAVKNGTKIANTVRPYAIWHFGSGEMYSGADSPYIRSATFDSDTGRLYITQDFGQNPRVDVYQITVPGVTQTTPPTSSPPPATTATPDPPANVTVN